MYVLFLCDLSFGNDQCQIRSSEGKGSPLLLSQAIIQLWTQTSVLLSAVMNQEVFAASLRVHKLLKDKAFYAESTFKSISKGQRRHNTDRPIMYSEFQYYIPEK